jgi:carboxymethylenebutenolidase
MTANSTFERPDGGTCPAYHAEPANAASAPAVVVIQEWWGLNDQIERVADRLCDTGYRVLVPDLYRGEVALEAAEAEHKMEGLDFTDAVTQDIAGAVAHLKQSTAKVGVMGFCMGGVLAELAAIHVAGVGAAVDWYGVAPAEAGDARTIPIPFQGHFGLRDQMFPPPTVDALEARLEEGNVTHEIYRYDAEHAFGNEQWDHYNAEAARLAWERSLEFFKRHLR